MSLFSWFKGLREEWALVKTITQDNVKYGPQVGKVYYHLYESNQKKRKTEIKTNLQNISQLDLERSAKRFDVYMEKIYRWEMGRFDPEIPRYSDIPEEDTANALKGSV